MPSSSGLDRKVTPLMTAFALSAANLSQRNASPQLRTRLATLATAHGSEPVIGATKTHVPSSLHILQPGSSHSATRVTILPASLRAKGPQCTTRVCSTAVHHRKLVSYACTVCSSPPRANSQGERQQLAMPAPAWCCCDGRLCWMEGTED